MCVDVNGLTSWSVEVSQIESMCMIRFPRREEHRQARNQSSECTCLSWSERHRCGFEEASKCAVQTVDSVVEELTQPTRCAGSPGLLAVDVVHRLVHEEPEGEAVVQPGRALRSR